MDSTSPFVGADLSLDEVEALSDEHRILLKEAGFRTAEDVLNAEQESLASIPGIDQESIEKIVEILNGYFEESE